MIIFLTIIAFLCDYTLGLSNKLPPEFKICRRDNPDLAGCFKEAVGIALPLMKDGIPDLNVPPAEPLIVESMTIKGTEGAVRLDQNFKNLNIFYVTEGIIDDVEFTLDNDDNVNITMKGNLGRCKVIGDYNFDGKILMIPIVGQGKASMNLKNCKVLLKLSGKKIEKKGKDHAEITDLTVDLEPSDADLVFENLFNGDEALGKQMNLLINENWKELYAEVKDGYNIALAAVVKNVASQIFNRVPMDDLFPR